MKFEFKKMDLFFMCGNQVKDFDESSKKHQYIYEYDEAQELTTKILESINESQSKGRITDFLDEYFKERDNNNFADPFSVIDGIDLILKVNYKIMKLDDITESIRDAAMTWLHIWLKSRIERLRKVLSGIANFQEICPLGIKIRDDWDRFDPKKYQDKENLPQDKESLLDNDDLDNIGDDLDNIGDEKSN